MHATLVNASARSVIFVCRRLFKKEKALCDCALSQMEATTSFIGWPGGIADGKCFPPKIGLLRLVYYFHLPSGENGEKEKISVSLCDFGTEVRVSLFRENAAGQWTDPRFGGKPGFVYRFARICLKRIRAPPACFVPRKTPDPSDVLLSCAQFEISDIDPAALKDTSLLLFAMALQHILRENKDLVGVSKLVVELPDAVRSSFSQEFLELLAEKEIEMKNGDDGSLFEMDMIGFAPHLISNECVPELQKTSAA